MFTGIVEETGTVRQILRGSRSIVLEIEAGRVLDGTRIGDSIATNGVCLTVTEISGRRFRADVMPESLRRTGLGDLQPGDPVNLERALPADGRLGGHLVSGHIDGTGRIVSLRRDDNAVRITVSAAPSLLRYIVPKGSVAVDGISLTVVSVGEDRFDVSVIPHTWERTVLSRRRPGDTVNLENDVIAKYVEKMLGGYLPGREAVRQETQSGEPDRTADSGLTLEFLQRHGF